MKQGYDVKLISDPGQDELSRAVQKIIDQVYIDHGHKDELDVADALHGLRGIRIGAIRSQVKDLPYETVLEVEGLPFDEIEQVLSNIEAENSVDRVLSGVI